jgi:hypothetical protein
MASHRSSETSGSFIVREEYEDLTSFATRSYDLAARNLVNASGEVLFGLTDVKPGAMNVQGPGAMLHNLMELSRIGDEELLPFAALLA